VTLAKEPVMPAEDLLPREQYDDIAQRIVFEDNHVLVFNKRCGELSQGDKTGDVCIPDLIKSFIKQRDAKPGNVFLGLVHRIDRPTSGLLFLAKTSKALSRMSEAFKSREVTKLYIAIVDGVPAEPRGELRHWMKRVESKNKSFAYDTAGKDMVEAQLQYEMILKTDRYAFLKINLLTGRHHQIRAQLAAIGLHIRGDLKYGAKRSLPDGGIDLHAAVLELPHPVGGNRLRLCAPVGMVRKDNVWDLYRALENDWSKQ